MSWNKKMQVTKFDSVSEAVSAQVTFVHEQKVPNIFFAQDFFVHSKKVFFGM